MLDHVVLQCLLTLFLFFTNFTLILLARGNLVQALGGGDLVLDLLSWFWIRLFLVFLFLLLRFIKSSGVWFINWLRAGGKVSRILNLVGNLRVLDL